MNEFFFSFLMCHVFEGTCCISLGPIHPSVACQCIPRSDSRRFRTASQCFIMDTTSWGSSLKHTGVPSGNPELRGRPAASTAPRRTPRRRRPPSTATRCSTGSSSSPSKARTAPLRRLYAPAGLYAQPPDRTGAVVFFFHICGPLL